MRATGVPNGPEKKVRLFVDFPKFHMLCFVFLAAVRPKRGRLVATEAVAEENKSLDKLKIAWYNTTLTVDGRQIPLAVGQG